MGLWERITGKKQSRASSASAPVYFTNTLSEKKEVFIPLKPGLATIYTCGPTVYGPSHIGNLRAVWLQDMIARVLQGAGYSVRRVINITDFGHLVTDGDGGEDKMTKGLKRDGLELTLENMRMMAEKYSKAFIEDIDDIGIPTDATSFPRASDYIAEQVALITTLEQKGYAYRTKEGVYFDTERFTGYGKLGHVDVSAQKESDRVEQFREKHSPADFVLWKPDPRIGWESPWGRGFPGWHIECSAMSRALLGTEIDIHTGGEDLIHIHHNNEIAQSESAHGRTFVRYWLHNAFLTMHGEKASKSVGNVVYLHELIEKGYPPLALRYFFLQAHYRTPLNFTWDAIAGAAAGLTRLWQLSSQIKKESKATGERSAALDQFRAIIRDDLATPQALGHLWESLRSEDYSPEEKWALVEEASAALGLALIDPPRASNAPVEASGEVKALLAQRQRARDAGDYQEADRIRGEIEKRGYLVEDRPEGAVLTKKPL